VTRKAERIVLSPEEYSILGTWIGEKSFPIRLVKRAQIILMAADGTQNQEIARRVKVSRPTVQLWRQRFLALRLVGLEKDAPRPGRVPRISPEKITAVVEATRHTKPPQATHWSTCSMARAQGLSEATIRRIWKRHNLKPRLVKRFIGTRSDIVGLYLNPPDKLLVFFTYEKKGRSGTMTDSHQRNENTTLVGALSMLDGKVKGDSMPRRRHLEFIRFLKEINGKTLTGLDLHLIVENHGTHEHPRVKSWLQRYPRFHLHFIPTPSSWLNAVEQQFDEITGNHIRRGNFQNVPALIAAIRGYLDNHNQNRRVFVWSEAVE
jgi:transposase